MEIQASEFQNDEERWIKNKNSDQLKKKNVPVLYFTDL